MGALDSVIAADECGPILLVGKHMAALGDSSRCIYEAGDGFSPSLARREAIEAEVWDLTDAPDFTNPTSPSEKGSPFLPRAKANATLVNFLVASARK